MTEARLRIDRLKLHLRGFNGAAASSLAEGLGLALAGAIDVRALASLNGRSLGRIDLGSIAAPSGAPPLAVRGQVAAAVAKGLALARPPSGDGS